MAANKSIASLWSDRVPLPKSGMRAFARLVTTVMCVLALAIAAPSRAEEEPLFKVGMILSSTGPWAEFGEAQAHALDLAREMFPSRFSRIRFIVEDCHYSGRDAVAAFNRLRDVDKVNLVFVWGVEPALAVAPIAESTKTPLVVSAVVTSVAQGKKYVIRSINPAEHHSVAIMEYLRTLGYKRIGLVKSQVSFFDVLTDGLRQNLRPNESLEIIDDVLPMEMDFRTTVAKAKRKSFDVIGVLISPSQSLNLFKELRAQRVTVPIFGVSPLQSRSLIQQAGGAMEGVLFVHNDVSPEFEDLYVKRFGNDIQIPWAANAFDFSLLIGELFNTLDKTPSAERILTLLSSARMQNGAGGPFTFVDSPSHGKYFEYPIVVKKISGGDFTKVFERRFD